MKHKIGVVGSAAGNSEELNELAREVGREIARNNCVLFSGACPGFSFESAKGAKEAGGFVVGVSPAHNLREHVEVYEFPTEHFDVIIYTGFGLKGRNVIWVRSCDAVIAVSGRIGTLNELTIAYDEGKTIGILSGTGGVADKFEEILKLAAGKKGGKVIYVSDPKKLVEELVESL